MKCCAKSIATIIRVGEIEAGLIGMEEAIQNVALTGIENDDELARALLAWIKKFGNYIAPGSEQQYMMALLREYKQYTSTLDRDASSRSTTHRPQS